MWELSDVITDIWSASEQQGDTPAGSDPAESSPDQKQGLPLRLRRCMKTLTASFISWH